jgi:hypothetical protein
MDLLASSVRTRVLLVLAATWMTSESYAVSIAPAEEACGQVSRFVIQIPAGQTERVLPTLTDLLRAAKKSKLAW